MKLLKTSTKHGTLRLGKSIGGGGGGLSTTIIITRDAKTFLYEGE